VALDLELVEADEEQDEDDAEGQAQEAGPAT
jgi:hypothetical protein